MLYTSRIKVQEDGFFDLGPPNASSHDCKSEGIHCISKCLHEKVRLLIYADQIPTVWFARPTSFAPLLVTLVLSGKNPGALYGKHTLRM